MQNNMNDEISPEDFALDGVEQRPTKSMEINPEDFATQPREVQETRRPPEELTSEDFEVEEEMSEDDLLIDESFINDAKILSKQIPFLDKSSGEAEYMADQQGTEAMFKPTVSIEELQQGMANANESFVPREFSDAEYAEGAMGAIGQIQWNLKDLGLTAMGVSEWPEEAQMALIRSMKRYDDMPVEMRHVGRAITGVATDPTTYLGFGAFAKVIGKVALKSGATTLLKSMVDKTVTGAALTAGVEGAAYMGGEDVLRQGIDNQGDFSKTDVTQAGTSAAIGFAAASGIGFIAGKLLTNKVGTNPEEVSDEITPEEVIDLATDLPEELDLQAQRIGYDGAKPSEGELLDAEIPTGQSGKADGEPEADIDQRMDGETDSYNNAEELNTGANDVGDDWSHMHNGKRTLNTGRLETSDNVKGFMESASAQTAKKRLGPPENLEQSRHFAEEEAARIKEETGGDISELIKEFADDAEELQQIRYRSQALRQLNVSLGERVFELAEKQLEGLNHKESMEFVEKSGLFANTMEMTKLISREYARGLGNYRLIMSGDSTLMEGLQAGTASADIAALSATIRAMGLAGNLKNGRLANGKPDLKGLRKQLTPEKLKGALQEWIRFRSAMMLSGPSTIEAAALSNLTRLWTEPFWEWAGHVGRGSAKKQARLRAQAQWAGNRRFAKESWTQAARAWKNGQHITDPFVTKIEGQLDESLANMSSLRRNVWERGVHAAHLGLLFLDEGVKANRSRSLIYADTVVEAAKAGFKTDKEFEDLLTQNLMAKIDGNGRVRDGKILTEIRETTFTSELEGDFGEIINKIASWGGGWGRLIAVPFIRAPMNIVSEGMMYFPGSKIFSAKQKRIMEKGTPVEKAKLKARKQLGGAAIVGLWFAAEEELYTGAGPADYKMREALKADGWQPHSIRVGDEWVSYAKLGPFSLLLGIVADINFITKMDTDNTNMDQAVSKTLGLLVHVVANNVLNKAYFQSVSQLMDGIQNPEASGNFVDSWILSHTPNILAQMNGDKNVREANTIMEKLQRRIPVWSESLGKQYDFYGRPIMKPNHDYGHLFANVDINRDPVGHEIYQLSESLDRSILNKPSYTLGITNTDFRDVYDEGESESVYAKYNRVLGEMRDPRTGQDMHQALEFMMNSTAYRLAPHSVEGDITSPKVKMITSIVNAYRGMAKNAMHKQSPAFRKQIQDRGKRIESIFN